MSRRQELMDELISEGSDQRASLQAGEPGYSSGSEGSQHSSISPEMDPYAAFQMGLQMGRALAAQEQGLASAVGERTAECHPEAEQDSTAHMHARANQSPSGSTSPASSEPAKRGYGKSRHRSGTDQPARKSRSPKKAQSTPPSLDPRLKFHMAMNLMGEKTAREYLVWLFLDEETGQLPPGSEEQIERMLERTLGRKWSKQGEPQAV